MGFAERFWNCGVGVTHEGSPFAVSMVGTLVMRMATERTFSGPQITHPKGDECRGTTYNLLEVRRHGADVSLLRTGEIIGLRLLRFCDACGRAEGTTDRSDLIDPHHVMCENVRSLLKWLESAEGQDQVRRNGARLLAAESDLLRTCADAAMIILQVRTHLPDGTILLTNVKTGPM